MSKEKFLNILDLGNSKIRFTVFNEKYEKSFSENISVNYENDYSNHFHEINKIIKQAEKKISSHIENIVLITDSKSSLSIDLSFSKTLDKKEDVKVVYNNILKEANHLIDSNYQNYAILHTILNQCVIDGKIFNKLPNTKIIKNIKKIKFDLKFVCLPKNLINNLKNKFIESNINITSIFCTSYVKTLFYLNKLNLKDVSFLEIGWERTTFLSFKNRILISFFSIPIGGFHITKDISKIFKITIDNAEKIKQIFCKSNIEFSYENEKNTSKFIFTELIQKNISINLLKKVILYRIQEIIDLIYIKSDNKITKIISKESKLFLIGKGSSLFNNNSFYIEDKFEFSSLNFYNESDFDICKSGLLYYINNYKFLDSSNKKLGIFEKFFNLFAK